MLSKRSGMKYGEEILWLQSTIYTLQGLTLESHLHHVAGDEMQQKPEALLRILFRNKSLSSYFSQLGTLFEGIELFLCVPQDLCPYNTKISGLYLIMYAI